MSLVPKHRVSDADDASFLSSRYGLSPDPWQFAVLEAWLGVRPDGKWAASRCGLAVPRQNGKNAIIEMRELFGMVVLGEKFLHTAHEVKTARKAFARLRSFFENEHRYPELAAMVTDVRQTNGQEAIILANGGSCEFVARSKGSGRGFTVDCLVMDEAQDLNDDHIEALLPTISAAPRANPQQIFTGTPPGPSVSGEIFTRLRQDGHKGTDKRLAWHEWSCTPDADLDAPQSLATANPALGIRLHREVAEAERGTLSDAGYGRERLGMWDEVSGRTVIDPHAWKLRADPASMAIERLTLAVDVSPDRVAAVGLAGLRADGLWHVELDEHRTGVDWVPAWLEQRAERNRLHAVVLDELSGLVETRNGRHYVIGTSVEVTLASAQGRDMAIACAKFYDAVMDGSLKHTDQPQVNVALSVARKRAVGATGWAWNRASATSDITPIVAETLALWGAQNQTVKKPTRKRSGEGRRATVLG